MIRSPTPDELERWIRSSWLTSYASSDWARLVTPRDVWDAGRAGAAYFEGHRALIDRLLARAKVLVMQSADASTMCDGWIAFEPGVLHYVYTRLSARERGVARALVAAAGFGEHAEYTHRSRGVVGAKLPKTWRFNPYLLTR